MTTNTIILLFIIATLCTLLFLALEEVKNKENKLYQELVLNVKLRKELEETQERLKKYTGGTPTVE